VLYKSINIYIYIRWDPSELCSNLFPQPEPWLKIYAPACLTETECLNITHCRWWSSPMQKTCQISASLRDCLVAYAWLLAWSPEGDAQWRHKHVMALGWPAMLAAWQWAPLQRCCIGRTHARACTHLLHILIRSRLTRLEWVETLSSLCNVHVSLRSQNYTSGASWSRVLTPNGEGPVWLIIYTTYISIVFIDKCMPLFRHSAL